MWFRVPFDGETLRRHLVGWLPFEKPFSFVKMIISTTSLNKLYDRVIKVLWTALPEFESRSGFCSHFLLAKQRHINKLNEINLLFVFLTNAALTRIILSELSLRLIWDISILCHTTYRNKHENMENLTYLVLVFIHVRNVNIHQWNVHWFMDFLIMRRK